MSTPRPTTAEAEILVCLLEGPAHGYAIMQSVEAVSRGATKLGPGTLYTALRRLTERGWVEEADIDSSDERRRFYRLTETGRKVLENESARWAALANSVKRGLVRR